MKIQFYNKHTGRETSSKTNLSFKGVDGDGKVFEIETRASGELLRPTPCYLPDIAWKVLPD